MQRTQQTRRYVGGVITDGARVLLGKRSTRRERYPGVWDIFGGHIEAGETAYEALCRELQEELGIQVQHATHAGEVTGKSDPDPDPFSMAVFVVSSWCYKPRLTNLEHDELQWFHLNDLDSLIDVIDQRLPSFLRKIVRVPDE